jgi:hypothetical protein
MAAKPCDTCDKECVSGIIYGNCQQFLTWRREINQIDGCLDFIHSLSQKKITSDYNSS